MNTIRLTDRDEGKAELLRLTEGGIIDFDFPLEMPIG